jgi:16S rRNA (uracil1498-N3)-methyltransferase
MHRFFLPPEFCREPELLLTDQEAHHAGDVLRLRPGDDIMVLDGAGGEYRGEILECTRHRVRLKVRQTRRYRRPPYQIILIQAITKGKTMEWIIQKATELSVARIVPIRTERTVPHLEAKADERGSKWRHIAREALKQSGNPWLPEVESPSDLSILLRHPPLTDLSLVAALHQSARHPRAAFDSYQRQHHQPPAKIAAWIGPEGDFTGKELETIIAAGASPISLGPQVLRSETAALYCLAILSYEVQARFAEPGNSGTIALPVG